MTIGIIKRWLGHEDGLCAQVRHAAEELHKTASELRASVAIHEKAPDPFASMLGTMWNNHENAKFMNGIDRSQSRVYRRAPSNLA